jgi:hypothetical protein
LDGVRIGIVGGLGGVAVRLTGVVVRLRWVPIRLGSVDIRLRSVVVTRGEVVVAGSGERRTVVDRLCRWVGWAVHAVAWWMCCWGMSGVKKLRIRALISKVCLGILWRRSGCLEMR